MSSNHLILCYPLLLLPSVFPSFRVFSSQSVLHIRWPKYWSFSWASVLSMNIQDWFPLGWTGLISLQSKRLKSFLKYHSVKVSILRHSAFFVFQLSHPYMTTGKTTALTRWTFVGKVMSLLSNTLSRLVSALLPRSNRLSITWLQLPSAVILEPKQGTPVTVYIISPSVCHEVIELDAMSFDFWMLNFLNQLFHCPLSLSSSGSWVPL